MLVSDTSIPVFTAGRSPKVGKVIQERLLPQYDITYLALSVEEVKESLPRILRGEYVTPSSGIGSNIDRPADAQRFPKLLVVGGGFSAEDYEDMKNSIDLTAGGTLSGDQVPVWIERNVPSGPVTKPITLPSGDFHPEFIDVIIGSAKARLDEAAREKGLI
ncbi:hypothetical protein H072_11556 [Dactylellina haptotyla CBS 200.50]|uniref:Uncharacterized protein n=1 Tax=Dactylellina haptotyla (strain CBS 200.50) TaxID=1284197 RepID=S7ZXE6_DACHA|nr:hypothetical protein H072_11556 [Dactylellina haptotyla CBS 200.50]